MERVWGMNTIWTALVLSLSLVFTGCSDTTGEPVQTHKSDDVKVVTMSTILPMQDVPRPLFPPLLFEQNSHDDVRDGGRRSGDLKESIKTAVLFHEGRLFFVRLS